MARRAEQNQNKRLATAILKTKGVKMEDWLDEQYQAIIAENTDLLISTMAAQSHRPADQSYEEESHNG